VTTLRRDVATDGRRATVRFSTDWREDAARRDFTINALYADPATRRVTDFFGGLADLAEGRVRFIGDADRRIDEDHLRILRFFRFHARFGQGAPDAEALAAVTAKATTMRSLSQERLAGELLRLLALPDPRGTVLLMIERGIFAAIIPEFDTASHDRLARLIASERACDLAIDPVRRLIAMAPVDAAKAVALATRLKVSTAIRRRFRCARTEPLDRTADPRHLAYAIGIEGARDRWLLAPTPMMQPGLSTGSKAGRHRNSRSRAACWSHRASRSGQKSRGCCARSKSNGWRMIFPTRHARARSWLNV